MKLSEIHCNPKNPRLIKDDRFKKLCQSIKEFPKMMALRPIIIDADSMILGGNMRFKALKELGYKDVPDDWVKRDSELTEAEKQRFIIADNIGFGEYDWDILANEWDKDDLIEWGLEIPDFAFKQEAVEDDYEIPDEIETDIVLGDLFEIGQHRLLCGDSTKVEDVDKLLNGQKADMVFTDPPYDIENAEIYHQIPLISKNTNVLIFASDKQLPFIFDSKIGEFKRLYVLDTNIASPTNNDVYINHIALLRFKIGNAIKFNNIHNGGRSIIKTDYRKNLKEGMLHNHQKSLTTLGLFMEYWSIAGQIIVDFFGGAGSTMAASEQLGRKCYMMELDPKYCQVIIDRMRKLVPEIVIKKNGELWQGQKQ